MKKKKTAALREIVMEYVTLFDKEMKIKAFIKKVNNMKTRLKYKTDKEKQVRSPSVLGETNIEGHEYRHKSGT